MRSKEQLAGREDEQSKVSKMAVNIGRDHDLSLECVEGKVEDQLAAQERSSLLSHEETDHHDRSKEL